MSYTIEYNKAVFHIENENKERIYFLFIRQGDNNCYDMNGLRAKSWHLEKVGTEKELWKTIGCRLGSINGGGLQRAVGFNTSYYTEEDYIKQYRSKIKNSKPLETMLQKFSVEAYIYLREEFKNVKNVEKQAILKSFIEKYEMNSCGSYYYDKTLIEHRYLIRDFESLKDLLLHLPKGWTDDYHAGFSIDKY